MWKKLLNRDKKIHMTVNTPIIPKKRYNESRKIQSQSISIQFFIVLKCSLTMVQNINKLKFKRRVQESCH